MYIGIGLLIVAVVGMASSSSMGPKIVVAILVGGSNSFLQCAPDGRCGGRDARIHTHVRRETCVCAVLSVA